MYDRYSFKATLTISIIGMTWIVMMSFISNFIHRYSLGYCYMQSKTLTQINCRDRNRFAHLDTIHTLLQDAHKYIHMHISI